MTSALTRDKEDQFRFFYISSGIGVLCPVVKFVTLVLIGTGNSLARGKVIGVFIWHAINGE